MDTDFERFRINPETRTQAAEVCARLGHELSEVLRELIARIARDGVLPFEMPDNRLEQSADKLAASEEGLWTTIKLQIEAETALSLLARFVADCSTTIDEQADHRSTDQDLVDRLTEEREAARRLRNELDVSDRSAVHAVLSKYGPLVSRQAS